VNLLATHSKGIPLTVSIIEEEIGIDFLLRKKVILYIVLLDGMDNGKEKR